MNYIREAMEYLENYNNLKSALENLKMDIGELKSALDTGQMGAMEYNDMPTGGGSSEPDDKIINNMYMLQEKRRQYASTKKMVDRIERVLEKLPPEDKKILTIWYVDGIRGDDAYNDAGCSERNFFRQKTKALRTLAIHLHGLPAI